MTDKEDMDSYKQGLMEGRLMSLEQIAAAHEDRLDRQDGRIRMLERSAYLLIGAIALANFLPELRGLLS